MSMPSFRGKLDHLKHSDVEPHLSKYARILHVIFKKMYSVDSSPDTLRNRTEGLLKQLFRSLSKFVESFSSSVQLIFFQVANEQT